MNGVNAESVSNAPGQLTAVSLATDLIYTAGVLLFARWLIRTSLGRNALVDAPSRRNRMPPYVAFAVFAVWYLGAFVLQASWRLLIHLTSPVQEALADNLAYCLMSALIVAAIVVVARFTFARGVRGFGLRPRTMGRDFGWACVDLFAVWPIVLAAIVATLFVGKLIEGPDFEIPEHAGLDMITQSGSLALQVVVTVLAVVVAPVVEEMVFRGLIQTTLRSYTRRPWFAIAATAAIFASVHANGTHWPALFILAMGLGYAYEHSGSLLRPMFMHALFNGITIVAALLQPLPA